jgi:hypothetical protein
MTCIATIGTIIVLIFCGLIIYVAGYTTGCEHGFDDAKDTKDTKDTEDTKDKNKDKNEDKNEDKNQLE